MTALHIDFPEFLPVSARRDEIMAALKVNQGIIVCGYRICDRRDETVVIQPE